MVNQHEQMSFVHKEDVDYKDTNNMCFFMDICLRMKTVMMLILRRYNLDKQTSYGFWSELSVTIWQIKNLGKIKV